MAKAFCGLNEDQEKMFRLVMNNTFLSDILLMPFDDDKNLHESIKGIITEAF